MIKVILAKFKTKQRAMISMLFCFMLIPRTTGAEQVDVFALKKNNEAVAKINAGDYNGAIRELDSAIRAEPHYVLAYSNRGLAYRKLSKYRKALRDYSKALQFSPADIGALQERASLREQLGDSVGALRDLNELVNHYADRDATFLLKRSQFKKRIGDSVGAAKDVELAGQKHE